MLRAVRFAARFRLEIESATAEAIRNHFEQLKRISPERIAEELRLMLTPTTRAAAWAMLWELRLVHPLMRFLHPPLSGSFRPERSLVAALAPGRRTTFGAVLVAATLCYKWQCLAPDVYPFGQLDASMISELARAMRQALKISNEEFDELTGTLRNLRLLLNEPVVTVAQMKRILASPVARPTLELLDAIRAIPGYDWARVDSLRAKLSELLQADVAPAPLVTGDDLTAAGLQPGPLFKRVLDAAYDAQLEDRVRTKEEAMELALRIAST